MSSATGLAGADLSVRLGSMVSVQPDGKLFDGNGVPPDLTVEPECFIGGRDAQLERALQWIEAKAARERLELGDKSFSLTA